MKLSDYVVDFLARQGIKHVFGLTGGAVVHLFDSADHHADITPIFCHHEQSAALAAAAYARSTNNLGAAIFTTGPGCTNGITGVVGAWQDSIPAIFISGQSRRDHLSHGKPVRQVGTQELDIVSIAQHFTKYAAIVESAERIRYHLEKALYLARSGRPGPVWLDLPLDLQWANINEEALIPFDPAELVKPNTPDNAALINSLSELLAKSVRPLVVAGYGIRLAKAESEFLSFIEKHQIPFVSSWTAADLVASDYPRYCGRLGMSGQRGANLAVQNCDLLLAIGSHLCIPQTTTLFHQFARDAKIAVVDIDPDQLANSTVRIDLPICSDAGNFLEKSAQWLPVAANTTAPWREKCAQYKRLNAVPDARKSGKAEINSFYFVDRLSQQMSATDSLVVDGGGTALYAGFQASILKAGQRILCSSAISSMGTGLPESIGACFANDKKRTLCIIGDGSLQLNLQEFQTIIHHRLPIKIFVINNDGYLAIRHTQSAFLDKNFVGTDTSGGLSFPDTQKIAAAYGIRSLRVDALNQLDAAISSTLEGNDPAICEIIVPREEEMLVKQGFSPNKDGTFTPLPLEDMIPFLGDDEFRELMITPIVTRPQR